MNAPWSRWILPAAVAIWLVYTVAGFRLPWTPIVVSDADSGSALRQLLFTSVAGLSLWSLFVRRQLGSQIQRHFVVIALGAGLIATAIYSDDRILTIKRSIIFNMGVISLLGILSVSERPIRQMQLIVVGLTGIAAWISVAGWFVFPADAVSIPHRPGLAGISGHPNTLAPAMVAGWVVSLGLTAEGRGRIALHAARFGQCLAIWLANSITSIVLMLFAWGVMMLLESSAYRQGVLYLLGSAAVLTVLIIGPDNVKGGALETAGRDASLSGRDVLWEAVWRKGLESPVFGSGYGAFWYEGRGREIVGHWNPRQSHNTYLDLFVDLGVVGTAIVLLIFGGGFFAGWLKVRGLKRGSPRRRAVASMVALAAGLLAVYGFGESFMLKLDKLPMFCLLWFRMLMDQADLDSGEEGV